MFAKLLIANRAEIACRVMRTARRFGIRTVAVYSDADAGAAHVEAADEAVRIGPPPARESYLNIDRLIDALYRTGADAVHPGYGFLSENAEFAAAVIEAGAVFVGPPATAIRAMGSKSEAKAIMAKAGVPLVPGYHGEDQGEAKLKAEAKRIGYPVLIKASAGGGGKGMRRVDGEKDFAEAFNGAKREAKNAFNDDRVLIEKCLERPRHIEIQVFADSLGNAVQLFERDCSIQRRHQKVVEEAPAIGMTAERRRAMGEAAVAAARAIGYVGAGTVEFLMADDGDFYFMEMNTRLQVEHPVTEMITGLDLVEWQLRVAAGQPLPRMQDQIEANGHAIETRLYAEDPAGGYLPSTGRLVHLRWPAESRHVRVDAGIREGDDVSVHYDPMLAKLVVWDVDRGAAVRRLRSALAGCQIAGVKTNHEMLSLVAMHPAYEGGEIDTGFLERYKDEVVPATPAFPYVDGWALAVADQLLRQDETTKAVAATSADPYSPWNLAHGWRLNGDGHSEFRLRHGDTIYPIRVTYRRNGYDVELPSGRVALAADRLPDGDIRVIVDGRQAVGAVARNGTGITVFAADGTCQFELIDAIAARADLDTGPAHVAAPMPGKIIQVAVKVGDRVKRGSALIVLEAMKMEHTILAPADGKIAKVLYQVGDLVEDGAELLTFEEAAA
ncbi:MAG: biotin carboxylase N-terminal domain-containing protein [Dongiaceae bacterium]